MLVTATYVASFNTDNDGRKALKTAQIAASTSGSLIIVLTLCCWQICALMATAATNCVNAVESSVLMAGMTNKENAPSLKIPVPKIINDSLVTVEHWSCDNTIALTNICVDLPVVLQLPEKLFPISQVQPIPLNQRTIIIQLNRLVLWSDCSASSLLVILFAITGISTVLAFFQVIRTEMEPKTSDDDCANDEELNHAFSRLNKIGVFFVGGLTFVIPPIFFLNFGNFKFSGLLAISGVLLIVTISAVFYSVLAVILDVINWLREHPIECTKRAQIVARFLAILQRISDENTTALKEGQKPYQQLIIVAHSQGTVITTEILRAIQNSKDHNNNKIIDIWNLPDIILFTMGSPLRQLYGCRFPHLFSWAVGTGQPHLFKVMRWKNVYGSRDYVGRTLAPTIEEDKCIGVAAHTHYWDVGSPIAEELDNLIRPLSLPSS